jgi:hypothetical protein
VVHRQRQLLRLTAAAVAAGLTLALAGCVSSDESGAAQRIADAIRPLPGVAAVDGDYRKTFTHGENFDLTVDLTPDATVDQAQRVARTFVAESEGVGFDVNYVQLRMAAGKGDLRLRPLNGEGRPPEDTDTPVALFFDVMAAAAVEEVSMQPGSNIPGLGYGVDIYLRQPVDTRAAVELQRRHPGLADADWTLRNPAAESHRSPNTYVSTGLVPDAVTQQVWTEVVRLVDTHEVHGEDGPGRATTERVTSFEVSIIPADDDTLLRFGEPIAAALTRLDRPVELTMDGAGDYIRVTIGGCRRHDPGHRPSPGEAKLAQIHERC